jgi:hypothetical protein
MNNLPGSQLVRGTFERLKGKLLGERKDSLR